jgi:hypothetical protein
MAVTRAQNHLRDYPEIIMNLYQTPPTFRGRLLKLSRGTRLDVYESSAEITFSAVNYGSVTVDNVIVKSKQNDGKPSLLTLREERRKLLLGTRFESQWWA